MYICMWCGAEEKLTEEPMDTNLYRSACIWSHLLVLAIMYDNYNEVMSFLWLRGGWYVTSITMLPHIYCSA